MRKYIFRRIEFFRFGLGDDDFRVHGPWVILYMLLECRKVYTIAGEEEISELKG